ncbi:MAG: ketoacyl-ACP synthase III [Candidatus Eisenbacteria bacterium]|uniref:Beta-ketoacyl-[acyl-carrier-protein] synthase III n=1 Tax=Eiseniibacteriota bacterium TaxID=2212470 RepID=A0A538SQC6_UNCEI|nr:MAG: ketoacyl-ACP synthase III [Candidatus Eisenbacteria bacterium]
MIRRPDGMRGATMTGTGMYVPDRVLTNRDLEHMVETSDEWIRERTGIRERRIAAPDQASSDLALVAAQRALESAGLSPKDVDQIVLATTTPDRFLPSCACTVQAKLGAVNAAAYDVFAACTGFVYGLGIARGIIGTGQADTVLVIGVETLSRIVDYTDRNTCVLFGDGAGAAVLQPCAEGDGILAISMGSDGSLGEVLEIPAGGSSCPASAGTVQARGHFIKMRGRELFKVAVRAMEESVRRTLEAAELTVVDIDLLVPHQANQRILDAVRERLGLPDEKVIANIERYGNTSSASIPISLDEVVREGRLKPGDHVSLAAFGGGATWGASLVRWTQPAPLKPALAVPAAAVREGGR